MALIYIVEDDKNIQEIEEYALKNSGYEVCCFDNAKDFHERMRDILPNLVLLDIMLMEEDGLSILNRMRKHSATKEIPVILVTAKASEIDTVKGLDLGADDYITKPFGIMELVSRVKAVLRRIKVDEETILSFDNIVLNQDKHVCMVQNRDIELTYKEYELLRLFLSNVGSVLSRDVIMNVVWGTDFAGETRTVDMHIKTLRRKLGEAGNHIVTVRNVGYKLK
ncbi:MAG: response regulator transcription factor [Eubacterium sp.]|nr:response regulator transcription factor [Eubacterium sp.]